MSWSLSLGRFAGTEVRVHLTFFLLLAWFAIAAGLEGGQAAALDALAFLIALFACVVAHEYGHVLTARAFGFNTRDITLLPIGGVASLERMPENPTQELLVAVAGPAVNVVIAAVLIVVFGANLGDVAAAQPAQFTQIDFVSRLAFINVMLVVFNMLPAFPMDGGRVFRALLSFQLNRVKATRIAALVGQIVAFGLGFLGLFGNPLLIFIALFVFIAASHEVYAVELDAATTGATVRQATITGFATLDVDATVGGAVDTLLATEQTEFPVTDGAGRMRGVLTRDGMIKALGTSGPDTPVVEVMQRDLATINRRASLADASQALRESGQSLVGVVDDNDKIVGIITLENVAEYMMVVQANEKWRSSSGRPAVS